MPVDQAPSRPAAKKPDGDKVVRYHDFIDEKIESTRRMVKVVDLATAVVELGVAVLLFLLLAVVVEHWMIHGGFPVAVRMILFGVLVAFTGYFAVRRLWPLCVHAINPVYAAQTIEHNSPSLKNGLINLLLFRQKRAEISDAIYRTIEEHAAHGLVRAPVDTAVDRSELIRLGYVLLAIVAVAAGYKVLSPKDPFVAVERVLMPWADIVPASRVTISEIKPGVTTISRGEFLDVSADVRGLSDDDSVVLRFTTDDGQIVARPVPLKRSSDGLRYSCRLADDPGATSSASAGVTRNLTYWLEAGDARSLDYPVNVVPAATILVERIDYHFPSYTGYVDHSEEGVGDIHAIEGTRVTVHARANGDIREANVDFDADGHNDLRMTSAEAKAHVSFDLALREGDRQTPAHASYVLRFTNAEGRENHTPVKHSINVDPDLPPEAEIRLPQERLRDVRLDEQVMIEVAARDADFSVASVRLRGTAGEKDVLTELLLKAPQKGQFIGKFMLTPKALGLQPGDVLKYWAEADDNRAPKPNTFKTEEKSLRVVSPNPAQQPPPNQAAKNNQQQGQQQPGESAGGNATSADGKQGQQGGAQQGNQQPQNGQQNQGQDGQGQQRNSNDQQQPGNQGGEGQSQGQQSKNKNQQNQGQQGQGEGQQQNNGDAGESAGGNATSADGKQNAKQQGANQQNGNQSQSGAQQDKQTGAGAAGSEPSQNGAQPSGARPDSQQGKQQGSEQNSGQRGERQDGAQQQPNESESPVSSEGDNDAEAFNRIQKHMEQKGDLKHEGENGGAGEGEKKQDANQADRKNDNTPFSRDTKQSAQPNQQDSKPSESAGGESASADGKPQSPGGEQTSSKGSPGGGADQKQQGSPNSQPGMQPKDKPDQAGSKSDKSNDSEPPAGANSKRESDSHGDQGGDKAGGGEEGGGQKSPHDGTGSAGANQSADKGAGQSGEKGKGENSSEAGGDTKSKDRTGAGDGKTPGKGTDHRDGTGDKQGGKPGDQSRSASDSNSTDKRDASNPSSSDAKQSANDAAKQEGESGSKGEGEKKQGDQRGSKSQEDGKQQGQQQGRNSDAGDQQHGDNAKQSGEPGKQQGGQDKDQTDPNKKQTDPSKQRQDSSEKNADGASGSSGQPGGAVNPQPSITGDAPEGDAANLEYARKQTDMVLDKLADQMKQKKVDDGLLKELGWSEADLKRFLDRWQERKAAAAQNDEKGEAAKRELDDALRSLGLRRGELKQNAAQKDTMRDLREGYRGPVPSAYKERLKAYNQGVSRARQSGE